MRSFSRLRSYISGFAGLELVNLHTRVRLARKLFIYKAKKFSVQRNVGGDGFKQFGVQPSGCSLRREYNQALNCLGLELYLGL